MKKLSIATALFAATTSLVTINANAYQAEIGGGYQYKDFDDYDSVSQFNVNGKYYINPVQVKDSPLAEAAFLDRSSNVNADITYGNNNDVKDTTYNAGVEYFVPNSNFYVGANVGRQETEINDKNANKVNTYGAEVGYLPAPGLLLALGVKGWSDKVSDKDGADPTVRAKYVTVLPNGHDINLEAYGAFGDLDEYKVKGDYFLDKTFSVGADYYNNDISKRDEWGISAKKYFNQNVNLEGRAGFGDNYNTYSVGVNYNF